MTKSAVETVQLFHFYGHLQPFQDYEVINEGSDWVQVKDGTYVPRHMIKKPWEHAPREDEYEREDEEHEVY